MKIAQITPMIPSGQALLRCIPLIWMLIFFAIPFFIVFKISLSEAQMSIPPYSSVLSYAQEKLEFALYLGNYFLLSEDSYYLDAYWRSFKVASIATSCCLIVAFPIAWAIASSKPSLRNMLLMLVVLPSWTSFLIRVYAWMGLLKNNGIINNALLATGIIDTPVQILYTDLAVYIVIVYTFLPFMILPLYNALLRLDYSLVEAAKDLGASPITIFFRIILPQVKTGIIAACTLVFAPVIGEFVIPSLIGSQDSVLIGGILWQEFFSNRDWPMAAAIACAMLVLLIIPILIFNSQQNKQLEAS